MISELNYIAYFENLATQSMDFNHVAGTNDAFFYLPNTYDLTEIDNAIKSSKSVPMLLLDSIAGQLDDNQSENYVQTINGQFTILDMAIVGKASTIRDARDKCLPIGLNVLARMKRDGKANVLLSPNIKFTISKIPYDPVGPMAIKHYGYTFRFKIYCPFGFSVNSGTWRDIPPA